MNANTRFFDDISKVMSNAMGVAQGAKDEAENSFNAWFDRMLAQRNLVMREEFDAVFAMAQKAREENQALLERIEKLEAKQPAPKKRNGTKKTTAKKS